MKAAFYSPIWNLADKNKRTPLAGLDARIFVKLALVSTTQLVSRMQRAGEDTNLDDETHELTARLQSIGYDWKWNESIIEPVDLLSNSAEIIRDLRTFVFQCASDDLDRISPGFKREAKELLAKLSVPGESKADTAFGKVEWKGHENKINPEWLKLENKPHLVPAICHPDAFKAFYLGPVTLAQLDAVTVGHWKEQRALVEWAITLLSSATPNQKLLSEDMQKEWCKGFGQWFAEASTGMPSIKLDPNGVYVHICKWLMEKPGRSIHRIDNLYRAICSTANKEQGWYADTATLPLLSDAILNCPK